MGGAAVALCAQQGVLACMQTLVDKHNECSARLCKYLPEGWQAGIKSNC